MQTIRGEDTKNLRWQSKTIDGIEVKIDKEQSEDTETSHIPEVVGFFAIAYDADMDGIPDNDEVNIYGSDPENNDTDKDGIHDGAETILWDDAWNADGDGDGFPNLHDWDADGDRFSDGEEVAEGLDPADPNSKPGAFPIEVGEVSVDHMWKRVKFKRTFFDPVVVANPLSSNDINPSVIRIRNVTGTGFAIRVQEWDYLDGQHAQETIGYIVMEAGSFALPGGIRVEAGKFETDKVISFDSISFAQTFNAVPVVIAATNSNSETDAVAVRLKNITKTGFELGLQEQEANIQEHAKEDISYIAWEPSTGSFDAWAFEVGKTDNVIKHEFASIPFFQPFSEVPTFIADMQTTHGVDPANLRWQNKTATGVEVKVAEEQSKDTDISHGTEVVGYFVFSVIEVIVDDDQDGVSNQNEVNLYGTRMDDADSDEDGIRDGDELALWGDRWNADEDQDGQVNLLDRDADGDKFADGEEVAQGFDPGDPTSKPAAFPIEVGEVNVDHQWQQITFARRFFDPVVVAKPMSSAGTSAAVIRIRDVSDTGFEIRVQEWDYLDGPNAIEAVGYLVVEAGSHQLSDGTLVEAGNIMTDQTASFDTIFFFQPFNKKPVVMSSITSFNEPEAVTARLAAININKFGVKIQEQELNPQVHAVEELDFIAWEPSSGAINGISFWVAITPQAVTDQFHTIAYQDVFHDVPVFLADMQTFKGTDTANLRWQNKQVDSVEIRVSEEKSKDDETAHTSAEIAGYMLFGTAQ